MKYQIEKIIAQKAVDKIAPGKVKVSIENDPDTGTPILCGKYKNKYGESSTWTEQMDRYYTDSKLFLMFFEQRAKWLMATNEEKLAFDDHPSQY